MNRTLSNLAAATAVALAVPVLAGCDEGAVIVPVTGAGAQQLAFVDGESLDAKVLAYLAAKGAPGATVAITKDSRLVLAKGYGYADNSTQRLMQPDTRSRIGSVSKFFTAVGALQLVEDGRIDLDQHVYAPSAAPLWGADPGATPGVVYAPGGVLEDPGAFLNAIVEGVDNLGEYFPPAEHLDELPSLNWALLTQAAYEEQIETVLDRADDVRVRNLLSHTAGFPKSGKGAKEAAAEIFGVSVDVVTEAQQHQAFLMGLSNAGAPFVLDPGTQEKYSNQGFSVAGHIVGLASDESDYRAYVEDHVLAPLGLDDVVPNNADVSDLDAQPHGGNDLPYSPDSEDGLNPGIVSRLGLATGGWSATARDLTRVMCSLDQGSNNLRSLDPESVELMADDAAPGAEGVNPLGWDGSSDTSQTKNGDVTGGGARITKFLPGAFDDDAEINVAMAINKGDTVPSSSFLEDLAEMAAEADIQEDFDLFDPEHACYVDPTFDVTIPSPTPHPDPDPSFDDTIATPTPDSTVPVPGTTDPGSSDPAPDRDPQPADDSTDQGQTDPDPAVPDPDLPGPAILDFGGAPTCEAPRRTEVSALIEASAGFASAELVWRAGSQSGTEPMDKDANKDKLWVAVVMPGVTDLVLTVTDTLGQIATATATVSGTCQPGTQLGLTTPTAPAGPTHTSGHFVLETSGHNDTAADAPLDIKVELRDGK